MLKEKMENLRKKANREEVALIIKDEDMLDVLRTLIKLRMNKISLIDNYGERSTKWVVCLTLNESDYEKLCNNLKKWEIYSCEEDRFGKYFEKRLGA